MLVCVCEEGVGGIGLCRPIFCVIRNLWTNNKEHMAKWIFNRYGRATAIDCGDAVYDSCGRFRLWVYDGN